MLYLKNYYSEMKLKTNIFLWQLFFASPAEESDRGMKIKVTAIVHC